jgi:hypothetical protein
MNSILTAPRSIALRDFAPSATWRASIERVTPVVDEQFADQSIDREFTALRTAYRSTGGIARGDDLARLLADHPCGDYVSLARLIVSGQIFCFERHNTFWVPMFQFNLRDLSVKRALQKVFDLLHAGYDGWTVAVWFTQPNDRLSDRRPVDLLDSDLHRVMEAARVAPSFVAG